MSSDATRPLLDLRSGRSLAAEDLFPLVLRELRRQAVALLRARAGHTLQPTALIHEAYLRLVKQEEADWRDRAHFLAVAPRAIRHVLVDHARRRNRRKRGGGREVVPLESALLAVCESSAGVDLEALHGALAQLARIRARAAEVVDMRFFAGMTVEDIAQVQGSSVSTVEREWRYARAWLRDALRQVRTEGSEHDQRRLDGTAGG